ncbi:hypothetical protein SmJEL517_g04225 [Synchytrium microbalum]|uniref:Uncharacterized protein n=1 Tax=Synchytrium microbalum TaxID=1806994 RepID=A0A507BUT1_9FUNG|nr:uncharacterized protein SmJEL517_g04225 [Synchytrium microbalum]TPX32687.1 hypothetical protein SmJEL517_g04225 [Synchytrium microbalum]
MQTTSSISNELQKRGLPALLPLGSSPYPALASSAICAISTLRVLRGASGYPNLLASAGFTFLFGGCGYVLTQDVNNGQSTAVAWGICYESLFLRQALTSRKPGPIAGAVFVGVSSLMYLSEVLTRVAD